MLSCADVWIQMKVPDRGGGAAEWLRYQNWAFSFNASKHMQRHVRFKISHLSAFKMTFLIFQITPHLLENETLNYPNYRANANVD